MEPNFVLIEASIANIERLLVEVRRRTGLADLAVTTDAENQASVIAGLEAALRRLEEAAGVAHQVVTTELLCKRG